MAVVSCEKNGAETPVSGVIDMNMEICSDRGVAVYVNPESSSEYHIGVYDAGYYNENADDMASILRSGEGNCKKMKGQGAAIFAGLEPSADYYICAVYDGGSSVEALPFRTSEQMTDIKAISVEIIDNAEYYMDGLHNFIFRITDAEFVQNDESIAGGFWDNGTLLQVNAAKEWKGIDHIPAADEFSGIYVSDESLAGKPGSILLNNTSMRQIENFEAVKDYEIKSVKNGIQVTGNNVSAISLVELSDGTCYSFFYEGEYTFYEGGFYGKNGYSPLLDKDLENLEYQLMKETYYCGEEKGLSHYTMACVNDPDSDSPFGGYNKHCLRLNIMAPHQDAPLNSIPEGTYSMTADTCEFAAIAGDYRRIDVMNSEYIGCYYYYLDEETYEQTMGFLTSGTVVISEEDGVYTIDVKAETHDGHKVSGKYVGALKIEEEPEWPW